MHMTYFCRLIKFKEKIYIVLTQALWLVRNSLIYHQKSGSVCL